MYDPEFGMAMAISKKALGNQGNYYNTLKKWVEPYWQKKFDENFIEVIRGYLDHCCEYIHPITLTYWVESVLDDTDDYIIPKLTRKEKERLRQLAYKEVPKAYSDWDKYVETNAEGAWEEVSKLFKEEYKEIDKLKEIADTYIGCVEVEKCVKGLIDCIQKTYDTVKESVKKEDLLTLKNGYPPKYDTNPKKEDEYVDIKPEEHIGDNSYDRWIKNTPFAEKIRARREAMSMSQKDVAAKIGVGTSTYGYWDSGHSRPSKEEHRQKLAEVLKFKLEELYEVERDLDGNVISTKVIK